MDTLTYILSSPWSTVAALTAGFIAGAITTSLVALATK